MRELGDDVTHTQTHTRTQPFIVKDGSQDVTIQDILGHPNTAAFVTHAGYLSFEESLCHQIPMVATPICYDQFDNAAEIESLGIGKSIKFTEITLENMTEALSEILNNSKFKEAAKKIGSALSPWKEMVDPVSR